VRLRRRRPAPQRLVRPEAMGLQFTGIVSGTPRVLGWSDMTPRQQAEHLVYAHGLELDELEVALAGHKGPVELLMAMAPLPRTKMHDRDHTVERLGMGYPHRHTKWVGR
jgi:hypothetical protein